MAAAIGASACSEILDPKVCTASFDYGLSVRVLDSITGQPPAQATLIAIGGGKRDSVGPISPFVINVDSAPGIILLAAGERPGTYSLLVAAPGYRDWRKENVVVTAGSCHVNQVRLDARLQRFQ